ncbi:hypothetical protein M2263_001450 [Providencia alcalifaciens]|nr:hypothetical protein [Providencia alcalifaciens]
MAFIEIPIKDKRKIQMQSTKIIEAFINDEDLLMNVRKDKFVAMCYLDKKNKDIENKLLDKLVIFNNVAELINN